MRAIKTIYLLMLAAVLLTVSCKEEDNYEVTLYSDAAITSFSLGTLNCYVGGVKTTVTGSTYQFQIDQVPRAVEVNGETKYYRVIENRDSLPVGTDKAHVITYVSVMNNGMVGIRDVDDPEILWSYSATDSIDYTTDRVFVVYASDGSGYTEYLMKVNVHQEDGDKFVWERKDGMGWPDAMIPALPDGIKQLLGRSTTEQYAYGTDDKLKVSHDDGATWQDEQYENAADISQLPTQDISLVSYPMLLADKTDCVLMAGNRWVEELQEDGTTQSVLRSAVWRKIVDYGPGAQGGYWTYMERDAKDAYQLPALTGLTLLRYDDVILAFGGDYRTIYESRDNGITWKTDKRYKMPADFDYSTTGVTVLLDSDNFIWLYCGGTGQVWRGRLTRLGWKSEN